MSNEKIYGTFCDGITGEKIVRELTPEEYEAYYKTIADTPPLDLDNE